MTTTTSVTHTFKVDVFNAKLDLVFSTIVPAASDIDAVKAWLDKQNPFGPDHTVKTSLTTTTLDVNPDWTPCGYTYSHTQLICGNPACRMN